MRILKIKSYINRSYYDILLGGLFPFFERLYKFYMLYKCETWILIDVPKKRKGEIFFVRIRDKNNVKLFNFPRSVSL